MKTTYASLIAAASIQSAFAQVVVEETIIPAPPVKVVTETVVEVSPAVVQDPVLLKLNLLVLPRDVVPATPAPGTVVETTETKSFVDVPGQPRRVYNIERSVVIVEGRELSYLVVPVLFEKETAKLLDVESRLALDDTATAILEVLKTSPNALFDIEGHTSTDGADDFNLTLSADRARRTHQELTQRYLIPASALSAHGYGEMYPVFPAGTEAQMALDRRVLVVRKF